MWLSVLMVFISDRHLRRSCPYTNAPIDKNLCTRAHSMEELEEWKMRHQYRMMKKKKAKEQKLFAFMDEVLDKYNSTTKKAGVVSTGGRRRRKWKRGRGRGNRGKAKGEMTKRNMGKGNRGRRRN